MNIIKYLILCCLFMLFNQVVFAQTQLGEWVRLRAVGEARQEVGVAELNGKIYLIGGFSNNSRLDVSPTVEVYDPQTDRWSFVAPLPEPLHHTTAISLGGRLYVIAGYNTLGFNPVASAFSYDPNTNRWTRIASLPNRRGALAIGVIEDKIYAVGGEATGATGELNVYDPKTNTWRTLSPMPTPREHIAAGVINGKLYVAGGRRPGNFTLDTLEEYDPLTDSWRSRSPMPTGRSGIAGAVFNNRLYIFGGEGNPRSALGTFAENESYDPVTDTWRSEVPMPNPRHGIGAAVIDNKIFIPSGSPIQGFGVTSVSDAYVVSAGQVQPNQPPKVEAIANQMIRGGEQRTIDLQITDPEADAVTITCDANNPSFVICGQQSILLTPTTNDNGEFSACVIVKDSQNNQTTSCFNITVINNRVPSLLSSLSSITLNEGETSTINIRASDPDTTRDPLGDGRVSLVLGDAPGFAKLMDDGNGQGTLFLAPGAGTGGSSSLTYKLVLEIRDNGNPPLKIERQITITVNKVDQVIPPTINGVSFNTKRLTIVGQNFASTLQVEINSQVIENSRILSLAESQVVLMGNKKKLFLKRGTNLLVVIVNGVRSTPFSLTLN